MSILERDTKCRCASLYPVVQVGVSELLRLVPFADKYNHEKHTQM